MIEHKRSADNRDMVEMTIDGHKVTITFADEYNPTIAQLVKNTLIDSYIRNMGLSADRQA